MKTNKNYTVKDLQTIILEVVTEVGFNNARLTDTPDSVGMDSLDETEVVMAVEEVIGAEIPEEWLHVEYRKKNFSELATILARKIEESNGIAP